MKPISDITQQYCVFLIKYEIVASWKNAMARFSSGI